MDTCLHHRVHLPYYDKSHADFYVNHTEMDSSDHVLPISSPTCRNLYRPPHYAKQIFQARSTPVRTDTCQTTDVHLHFCLLPKSPLLGLLYLVLEVSLQDVGSMADRRHAPTFLGPSLHNCHHDNALQELFSQSPARSFRGTHFFALVGF